MIARPLRPQPLQDALLVTHLVLLFAAVAAIATAAVGPGLRVLLFTAAIAPLAAGLPGLRRGRQRTYQWLALAMVPFAGISASEVVATLGRAVPCSIVLLASLVELALLFMLTRRAR
ncbi:MAG TPA: DUF2069 domain-containing protein [Gammaproteobacteria bacterium]|nr:DUF2069 domain-containing protein [Gammaproteobacteria bacterium]